MAMNSRESDVPNPIPGGLGPIRELRNLQASGSASLAELREFLAKLKGRKPQEVIGIVSASLLAQSMAISVGATVAILVIFTVVPYVVYGPPQAKRAAAKPATTASPSPTPDANAATAQPGTPAPAVTGSDAAPDAAKASKAMGLDEAKSADPKKNPLDSPNLDKLLDGIDK